MDVCNFNPQDAHDTKLCNKPKTLDVAEMLEDYCCAGFDKKALSEFNAKVNAETSKEGAYTSFPILLLSLLMAKESQAKHTNKDLNV